MLYYDYPVENCLQLLEAKQNLTKSAEVANEVMVINDNEIEQQLCQTQKYNLPLECKMVPASNNDSSEIIIQYTFKDESSISLKEPLTLPKNTIMIKDQKV